MKTYREFAEYSCARGHSFETDEGPFSPFQSRACPHCGCSASLVVVYTKSRRETSDPSGFSAWKYGV